ncbi:TetR family transcriptional regulator [Microbacterium sp. KUDC0406]|uniref:TetR/AcrR family transcriptional regulator n=1 Tax=Microbacterium sp. KUDC0406 TaxID=2909588 RepID=UPI001F1B1F79|nr:TetR/AcrR family transcriptional regulator [Microbacterium sp. KUDC0406]UJP09090.1 TetR family transcriptional regulator [Microbacterium sp. KUDC0406]
MPKIVDVERRREDIARACWRVIVRHGIAGVTTRELAREAGIGSGVLFHYFPDKEAIIFAAFELLTESFRQHLRINIAPARDARERLRLVALSNLPLDPERADEFGVWLSMWAHTYTNDALRSRQAELYQSWRDILANLVRDALSDGYLDPTLDASVAAAQLSGITDGLIVQMMLDPSRPVAELAVKAVDDLLDRWWVGMHPAVSARVESAST